MTTPTTNFAWEKPDVAAVAEQDRWGTLANVVFDAIDAEMAVATVDRDFDGFQAIEPKIKAATEALYDFTADISASAVTIDYNNGNAQKATLPSNCAITFTNFPTSHVGSLSLHIKQDATGGRAVTFAQTYKTTGGAALAPVTTANAINVYRVENWGTSGNNYYIFLNAGMA